MHNHFTDGFGQFFGYWFDQPKADEFGPQGLHKHVLDSMDVVLRKSLANAMKGYNPGEAMRGTDPNNRWRVVSCMQKAIRFGEAQIAKDMASVGFDIEPQYTMRRLGVIAMEDVAAGDLAACAMTLAALGSVQWRRDHDERRVLMFLAESLALSVKDRTLTELVCLSAFDQELDKQAAAMKSDDWLAAEMHCTGSPVRDRMTAAWLLAGTRRYEGPSMPADNDRKPGGFFKAATQMKLSRLMLYLMHRTAQRCNDALFVAVPFMHEMIEATEEVKVVPNEMMPPKAMIGSLLAASYDTYTREGRQAMRRWAKTCDPIAYYRNLCIEPPFPNDDFLGHGLFCGEGGKLDRRLMYGLSTGSSEYIRWQSHMVELEWTGLQYKYHKPYLAAIMAHLPELNEIRKEIVWTAHQKSKTA